VDVVYLQWRLVDDETGEKISYPLTTWNGVVSWARHACALGELGDVHDARVEVSQDDGKHWRTSTVFPWDVATCGYRTERRESTAGLVES
jgi:hypothetical protein